LAKVLKMLRTVYLILNICIAFYIVFIACRRSKTRGGRSLLILSLAVLSYYIVVLLYTLSPSDLMDRISTAVTFFCMTLAATALFTFSLEYTHPSYSMGRFTILLFTLIPFFTQVIYWVPENLVFFSTRISLSTFQGTAALLEKINILYCYNLIAVTLWLLLGRTNFLR